MQLTEGCATTVLLEVGNIARNVYFEVKYSKIMIMIIRAFLTKNISLKKIEREKKKTIPYSHRLSGCCQRRLWNGNWSRSK